MSAESYLVVCFGQHFQSVIEWAVFIGYFCYCDCACSNHIQKWRSEKLSTVY